MSREDVLVWSGADGAGRCRFAWVEPITTSGGRCTWLSRALADETEPDESVDADGRDGLVASPMGVALWRRRRDGGYALAMFGTEIGRAIWESSGPSTPALAMGLHAIWVPLDFSVMRFAQRDGASTRFPDARLANGLLRIVPVPDELGPIDLNRGIEVALPTGQAGPGRIAVGPGYIAIVGPQPYGVTEWETDGARADVIAAPKRVWIAIGDDCMAIDLEGRGRARVRGRLCMADAAGALVDTGRGVQLVGNDGELGPMFPRCTAGALNPARVALYETYEGPDKLRIRLIVCDRESGARVAELPMGNVAMAGAAIYSASGTRVHAWPLGKTYELGVEIRSLVPVDGGVVVRTRGGDVMMFV